MTNAKTITWRTTVNLLQSAAFGLILGVLIFAIWIIMYGVRNHTVDVSHDHHREALTRNQFWTALTFRQPLQDRDLESLRLRMTDVLQSKDPAYRLLTMTLGPNQWSAANQKLGGIVADCVQDSSGYCTDYAKPSRSFDLQLFEARPSTYQRLLQPPQPFKTHGNITFHNVLLASGIAWATLAFIVFLGVEGDDVKTWVKQYNWDREEKQRDLKYLASLGPRERRLELAKREIEQLPQGPERTAALTKIREARKLVRGESTVETDARLADLNRDIDEVIQESKTWQDTYRRLAR